MGEIDNSFVRGRGRVKSDDLSTFYFMSRSYDNCAIMYEPLFTA